MDSSYGVYNDLMELDKGDNGEDEEENVFYIPTLDIRKSQVAFEYCLKRGITEELISYYDMRLGMDDLFGRIVIPNQVFGDGRIWTDMYSARSYIDQEPRYQNPRECNKEEIVFNIHRIPDNPDVIYVNEGVITAVKAGKEAVAIYGSYPSDSQVSQIVAKKPKRIMCTLDNDESGQHGNKALLEKLSNVYKGELYEIIMPPETDAADLGEERYKSYVEENKMRYFGSIYSKMFSYVFNSEQDSV